MPSPPPSGRVSNDVDRLRRMAEDRLREETPPTESSMDAATVLHDLRVHQIELEMQNDELRRTEVALEASRARYFDLYDLAPVGYITITEAGFMREVNLTAARLLGVTRGTLAGQPLSRFIVPDDQDTYYLHRRRLFATGAPQVVELRLRREDGSHFWARIDATTAPDVEAGGELCRATVSDISERKRLEGERLQFERELQRAQKMESLARMAGAIAHHFNNQLGVVMGSIELAKGDPVLTPDCLENALVATRKAASVSGLLLTYLGQSSGNHAPLDLSDACARILPMLRAAVPGHVTVETDLPTPGPTVNGNAVQLQLMLTNLVTNAWEAVGGVSSTVRITLTRVRGAEIPADRRAPPAWQPAERNYACLSVYDRGVGIDAQDIEKVFEPFFTTKFIGRGLGLPVVLGILHAHDGGLVMDTRRGPESGSVFRVYLPITHESVSRPSERPSSHTVALTTFLQASGTVLLVEDDALLRWAASQMLTSLGCQVLEACDGAQGVEVFRQHHDRIGLVVCDLTMPHLDGWETLAALRRLSPDVRVVLTSGYDEAHVMAEDRGEQPQAFLAKPFSIEALRHALERALDGF